MKREMFDVCVIHDGSKKCRLVGTTDYKKRSKY